MVILKASTRPVTKTTIFPSSTMMMMTVWLLSRPFVRFKCSEMTKPSLFVPKPLVKSLKKNVRFNARRRNLPYSQLCKFLYVRHWSKW
jgi:hypothetical protein